MLHQMDFTLRIGADQQTADITDDITHVDDVMLISTVGCDRAA
jgi:hypothetical protein